jgi:pimeloyl-ACP methyl ester carboxylesterase
MRTPAPIVFEGRCSVAARWQLFVFALLWYACFPAHAAAAPAAAGVKIYTGEIDGAKFAIARPAQWNGRVLLLAHGFREASAPLVADLNPNHLACRTLLDQGWVVATTSYRRNGMIIRDAIADLENLREHIVEICGEPHLVILEGDAMGGAIVALIAEQFADHYQGAVAVDMSLQTRGSKDPLTFNLQPQIPLVLLTNQSELAGPRKYAAAPFAQQNRALVLEVSRDGPANVNQRERLVALHTLIDVIDQQPVTLPTLPDGPMFFDATQEPVPGASQVRPLDEGGFESQVTEVTAISGDLVLNAQLSDFAAADIAPDTWFELTARDQTYRVLYGRNPASVKPLQWVSFPDADGVFILTQNAGHKAATPAATSGLKEGDRVVIHRLREDAEPTPP